MTSIVGKRIGSLIEHHGHLYLTEEHICFSGHILGETKLVSNQIFYLSKSKEINIK